MSCSAASPTCRIWVRLCRKVRVQVLPDFGNEASQMMPDFGCGERSASGAGLGNFPCIGPNICRERPLWAMFLFYNKLRNNGDLWTLCFGNLLEPIDHGLNSCPHNKQVYVLL